MNILKRMRDFTVQFDFSFQGYMSTRTYQKIYVYIYIYIYIERERERERERFVVFKVQSAHFFETLENLLLLKIESIYIGLFLCS